MSGSLNVLGVPLEIGVTLKSSIVFVVVLVVVVVLIKWQGEGIEIFVVVERTGDERVHTIAKLSHKCHGIIREALP